MSLWSECDDTRSMNTPSSGPISPENYLVDPQLVAQAIIDRLAAGRCSAVLVPLDAADGQTRCGQQREPGTLLDKA